MAEADDRLAGARIADRYTIVRALGSGGMASVFEAVDDRDNRPVAIKLVRRSADRVDRFEREILATRRIGGPSVCELLDAGTMPDGRPYLVMPLLAGMSLRKLLDDAAPLPLPLALSIADQVLGALEQAHAAGILHRDLKPENVFLLDGQSPHFVKVLDFGIARLIDGGGHGSHTATGQVVGTVDYMAPEQARGQRDQDERVDVWSVGILLYEMLTGARPFEGDSYGETLAHVLFDPFPAPTMHQPDLPLAIEDLILRALQRNRDERFSSARAMREALQPFVTGGSRPTPITVVGGESPDVAESTLVEAIPEDRDTEPTPRR